MSHPYRILQPTVEEQSFPRVMAILAWVMVLLGPAWFSLGHALFNGGEGGWMIIINLLIFGPVLLVALLIHGILVTLYGNKVGRFQAGPVSARVSLALYILIALYPLLVEDAGDSGPVAPSRLSAWFGVSSAVSGTLMAVALAVIAALSVAVIVVDAVELGKARRMIRPQSSQRPQHSYPHYAP